MFHAFLLSETSLAFPTTLSSSSSLRIAKQTTPAVASLRYFKSSSPVTLPKKSPTPPLLWFAANKKESIFAFLDDAQDQAELNANQEEEEDDDDDDLLNFLPDSGRLIPPQLRQCVRRATKKYVFGAPLGYTLQEIAAVIEEEHRSRDVPVQIGNVIADVTKTGEALDEFVAEILSVSALYRLPSEVTLELLRAPRRDGYDDAAPTEDASSLLQCQSALAAGGWRSVAFPQGLAVRPKTRYRFTDYSDDKNRKRTRLSWFHRAKTLQRTADRAVQLASETKPPEQLLLEKEMFFRTMGEQFPMQSDGPTDVSTVFFPTERTLSLRYLKRLASKKYAALKRKGRAGLISYCLFNFAYYTAGILWYWPRVAAADPLTTHASVATIVARKFGKVFAYLYAVSQLCKIPKLFTAMALAQWSSRCLSFLRRRLRCSETVATVLVIAGMVLTWGAITAVPVLSEFNKLRRLLYLDEQMVQVYGLQPV
jgi:hypothetical protein